jgi:hypothetical protein
MNYTAEVIADPNDDNYELLVISTTGTSVDKVLAEIETLPEVIEFLKLSTLGFEYLEIHFNHGQDIMIKIPRYA